MTTNLHDKMLAAIDALFSASDAVEEEVAENLLLDVRDEINKHKLAAKSLTEGLRLDDWDKIGCVNHDCDQCKAQPAREWVSLTMSEKHELNERLNLQGRFPVIAAIEEIIRRKNT